MRKYWKWILSIIALLLVGLLIWFIFFYHSVPRFSDQEKDKIEEAYNNTWFLGPEYVKTRPIVWYDENGGIEEDGVWRYVGTYGDCYAFLKIGDNNGIFFEPVVMPYPILGLTREISYPIEANIVLYHTKKDFTYMWGDREYSGRLVSLGSIENREEWIEEWITDAQLERLTRDVEKIAAAHN